MSNDNMSATSSFMHRTVLKRNPTPSEAQKMNAFHAKKREQQATTVPLATPPSNLSDVRTSDLPEDHQPPVVRKAGDVRTAIAGDATFKRMFETYTKMARERREGEGNAAEGNDGVVNEEEEQQQQQPPRGQSQSGRSSRSRISIQDRPPSIQDRPPSITTLPQTPPHSINRPPPTESSIRTSQDMLNNLEEALRNWMHCVHQAMDLEDGLRRLSGTEDDDAQKALLEDAYRRATRSVFEWDSEVKYASGMIALQRRR